MTSTAMLRAAISGLIGLAAAEEEMLLAGAPDGEEGDADHWAALAVVAHNSESRDEQAVRLAAVRAGQAPPGFAQVDHRSPQTYQRCSSHPAAEVASQARRSARDLADGLGAVSRADLTDPARHPWLRGRQLWLQVAVRGFWHPLGHIGDYHLSHGQPGRAVGLHEHALATATHYGAPDPVLGMALYSLACAQAQAGDLSGAAQSVTRAIGLNSDLRASVAGEQDLAPLRESGALATLLRPA